MKLGVHVGYWGLGLSADDQLALVQEAERLGYDSVWTAEAYGSDAATILGWLAQAVLFSVLALISVAVYRRWFRGKGRQSDKPLLNRRAEQLVGSVAVLDQAIEGGRGRVKIDDAFWTVEGPDLPVGMRVRVVAVNGMTLKVQEA